MEQSIIKYKKELAIALVVLVLVYVYNQGKNKGESEKLPQLKLPDGGYGIPSGWKEETALNLATQFEENTTFFSSASSKSRIYISMIALTNDQLVFLNNTYNAKYGQTGGWFGSKETMIERLKSYSAWITDESYKLLISKFAQLGIV